MDGESPFGGSQRNVLGGLLEHCSSNPLTGYFRDGCCNTDISDTGLHTVCALMDESFLPLVKKLEMIYLRHAQNLDL